MAVNNVLYWNAQGLSSKCDEFLNLLIDDGIDIACVCETHLTNNSPDINSNTFQIIRQDRLTHLGGLMTFIHKDLEYEEINCGTTNLIEYLAVRILSDRPFLIINTYVPGGAKLPDIKRHLYNDLTILLNQNCPFFVVGDLNAKNTLWNCKKNNIAGKIVAEVADKYKCIVSFPSDPTYCPVSNKKSPSTIDLIISNAKIDFSRPYVKNIFSSDHVPVLFDIKAKKLRKSNNQVINYRKTNWKNFRHMLDIQLIDTLRNVESELRVIPEQIDCMVTSITSATTSSLSVNTPKSKVYQGVVRDAELDQLISQRNYFKRRWLRNHRDQDGSDYKRLNNLIKVKTKLVRQSKFDAELRGCAANNNNLYKMIKKT